MAQGLLDSYVMEVIGVSANMNANLANLIVMEVLGKFQFGDVGCDEIIMEIMGAMTTFDQNALDSMTIECIGAWDNF